MRSATLLRTVRARAGLSQRELAVRAGTSQAMIARYEREKVAPSIETLERLLACCGERLTLGTEPVAQPSEGLARLVHRHRAELRKIAARHHATRLRLFGSAARGQDTEASDLDFLVELRPGGTLLDLAAIRREAHELLGAPVDVVTPGTLRDVALAAALRDAVVV